MTSYQQGAVAGLQAQFLDHPSGNPADPTSITLEVLDQDGDVVAGPWVYPGTITRTALGMFLYLWTIPSELTPADYTVSWTAVISGSSRTGYEGLTVVAGPVVLPGTQGWASVADVASITGNTVTGDQLAQAAAVIDMYSVRTYAAVAHTGTRDQYWLKLAVAYQAAWMLAQFDMFSRLDFTQIGKERGTPVAITESAMTLAPLARIALRRVSWLRSRSIHIRSPFEDGLGPMGADPSSDASDAYLAWTPMGDG